MQPGPAWFSSVDLDLNFLQLPQLVHHEDNHEQHADVAPTVFHGCNLI